MKTSSVITLVLGIFLTVGAGAKDFPLRDAPPILSPQHTLESFTLPPGYEINLFASEADFPIANLVAMKWDRRGRLWVANIPSFPQVTPDEEYFDSIVILEDTDNDGRADKHTVFADNLYLPLGFVISDQGHGAYVSGQQHLIHLLDTDGDDVADQRRVILQGFGTEDSHHAISAFQWSPDGAIHMADGIFLVSSIETPWGPRRSRHSAVFRYRPSNARLDIFSNYGWSNPWGIIFDRWGHPLMMDASPGENYYLSHLMQNYDYDQIIDIGSTAWSSKVKELSFFKKGRPNCGAVFLSSANFPDEEQGTYLNGQMVGFNGLRWVNTDLRGSGYRTTRVRDLVTSTDESFRPVDLNIGGDGALYIADFYNPIVGHMTYEFRDPRRDKQHGRIWRVRYKDRPLDPYPDFAGASLKQLFGMLTHPTLGIRRHALRELQERDKAEVLPATGRWVASLDMKDADDELRLLSALWINQSFDELNLPLIESLLQAKSGDVRASAARSLRFEMYRIKDSMPYWKKLAMDEHMRVRLEAVNALSFIETDESAKLILQSSALPMDTGLYVAMKRSLDYLARVTSVDLAGTVFEARVLTDAELKEKLGQSYSQVIGYEAIRRATIDAATKEKVLQQIQQDLGSDRVSTLFQVALALQQQGASDVGGISQRLAAMTATEAAASRQSMMDYITSNADDETAADLRRAAYAGLMLDGSADPQAALALAEQRGELDLLAGGAALIKDPAAQQRVQPVLSDYIAEHPDLDSQVMLDLVRSSLNLPNISSTFEGLAKLAASDTYRVRRAAIATMHQVSAEKWPKGYEAFRIKRNPTEEKLKLGYEIYIRDGMCGTCHQPDGRGVAGSFPPLMGSQWVEGDPERLIKIVQAGMVGPIEIDGVLYNTAMPPLGVLFTDEELAAVLTYVRTTWDNIGSEITTEQVSQVREAMDGRLTPWTVDELLKLHPLK